MKLYGVIHSIGGFHTIRGFAPLADLADMSMTENFQRELIPEHKEELKAFYTRQQDLFFPEVVLSHTLRYNFSVAGAVSGTNPIRDLVIEKKEFVSNVDGIKFKPLQTEVGKQQVVEITVHDSWLKEGNKPFSRIDGNHRISAFLDANERKAYDTFSAPFCLILFENTVPSQNSKKIIFHNINSKAKPLTTEEELKGIIGNPGFSDTDLQSRLGWSYYQTRLLQRLFEESNLSTMSNIKRAFYNKQGKVCLHTVLHKLVLFLRHNAFVELEQENLMHLPPHFELINIAFNGKSNLINTQNSAFLIAAFGVSLHPDLNLEMFTTWLASHQLGELQEVNAQSLFDIYVRLKENRPKVFVAMPYYSPEEIKSYNETYQQVVDKLNEENPDLGLCLNPIMSHQGMTRDIVANMIAEIDECAIFIADISESNVNVAYELGYARSRNKPSIIVKRANDEEKVPFDYEHDVRKPYNPLALTTLRDVVYEDMKATLIELGFHFN